MYPAIHLMYAMETTRLRGRVVLVVVRFALLPRGFPVSASLPRCLCTRGGESINDRGMFGLASEDKEDEEVWTTSNGSLLRASLFFHTVLVPGLVGHHVRYHPRSLHDMPRGISAIPHGKPRTAGAGMWYVEPNILGIISLLIGIVAPSSPQAIRTIVSV